MKKCSKCQLEKIYDDFYKQKTHKDGYRSRCKDCYNEYYARPEVIIRKKKYDKENWKKYWYPRKYKITWEQRIQILEEQKRRCKACGKKLLNSRDICVDHDHETGEVRGLLCQKCNTIIGWAYEDINLLNQLMLYLSQYQILVA